MPNGRKPGPLKRVGRRRCGRESARRWPTGTSLSLQSASLLEACLPPRIRQRRRQRRSRAQRRRLQLHRRQMLRRRSSHNGHRPQHHPRRPSRRPRKRQRHQPVHPQLPFPHPITARRTNRLLRLRRTIMACRKCCERAASFERGRTSSRRGSRPGCHWRRRRCGRPSCVPKMPGMPFNGCR